MLTLSLLWDKQLELTYPEAVLQLPHFALALNFDFGFYVLPQAIPAYASIMLELEALLGSKFGFSLNITRL